MASTILAISTITEMCSVAILRQGEIVSQDQALLGNKHAEQLLPMVACAMKDTRTSFAALDGIAVARGPGSFTGIRIGLAAARGLALAAAKPLIGVGSLDAIAYPARNAGQPILAVLDANRGQIYAQSFTAEGETLSPALVIAPDKITELMLKGAYTVVGTGIGLVRPYLAALSGPNLKLSFDATEGLPRASDVAHVANSRPLKHGRAARVDPLYLRASYAMVAPQKNGIPRND